MIVCHQCQHAYEAGEIESGRLTATICPACGHSRKVDRDELEREARDKSQGYRQSNLDGWTGRSRMHEAKAKRSSRPYPVRYNIYCGKCGLLLAKRSTLRGLKSFKCKGKHRNYGVCHFSRKEIIIEDLTETSIDRKNEISNKIKEAAFVNLIRQILRLQSLASEVNNELEYRIEEYKNKIRVLESYPLNINEQPSHVDSRRWTTLKGRHGLLYIRSVLLDKYSFLRDINARIGELESLLEILDKQL